MVQYFGTLQSHSGRLADLLGSSLGQGLSNFANTYYANKDIESVLNNPELKDADTSKKLGALETALRKHGEVGQQLFQNRLMIEQQEAQEKQNKLKLAQQEKADLFKEREVAAKEMTAKAAETKANAERAAPGGVTAQSIPPEIGDKIANVLENSKGLRADELGVAFAKAGVPPIYSNSYIENRRREQEQANQSYERGYDRQKDFINDITNQYKTFETEFKPRYQQLSKLSSDAELVTPIGAKFMEKFGIPLGSLEDPSSELFSKVSQDLLKGLPDTYGSRILKVEVDNFLKTIPTLLNSADGRRLIISNMMKLGEMKEVMYKEMQNQQRIAEQDKAYPFNFQQKVIDSALPQIRKLSDEFVKIADIKSVPENTVPFFDPQGTIRFVPKNLVSDYEKMGGKRIW